MGAYLAHAKPYDELPGRLESRHKGIRRQNSLNSFSVIIKRFGVYSLQSLQDLLNLPAVMSV